MTRIPKAATTSASLVRRSIDFPRARDAFAAFLRSLQLSAADEVLLPAYIGWSSREGSGVYDPVAELRLKIRFYRMTGHLHIDLGHLEERLQRGRVKVAVIIHYFGYPDPAYEAAVALCRRHGAAVLEDEAHAMLTDLVLGRTGRLGDVAIYSLHKMLPVETGGMLVVNSGVTANVADGSGMGQVVWDFDLATMAQVRQRNAAIVEELLAPLAGRVDPLWPGARAWSIPQTYPVRIRAGSRDVLYEQMNAAGFGVVSLYHTLIEPLRGGEYPDEQQLARQIMNLPVHHDASVEALGAMVEALDRFTRGQPRA